MYGNTKGFVKYAVIFIVLVSIILFFGINVAEIVESKPIQWAWHTVETIWERYLEPASRFIWEKIFIGFIWENIIEYMEEDVPSESGNAAGETAAVPTTTPETLP